MFVLIHCNVLLILYSIHCNVLLILYSIHCNVLLILYSMHCNVLLILYSIHCNVLILHGLDKHTKMVQIQKVHERAQESSGAGSVPPTVTEAHQPTN